jgi:prepilin peptidase CpaA
MLLGLTQMAAPLKIVLAVLVCAAAMTDLRWRRIPNWLTVSAFAVGVAAQVVLRGSDGGKTAALGFAAAVGLTFPLFALRALGGGDVKLMAAAGAMTGPWSFLVIFILNAILGGVAAVVVALRRRRLLRTLSNAGAIAGEIARGRAPHTRHPQLDVSNEEALTLPRGAIFAIATLLALFAGV